MPSAILTWVARGSFLQPIETWPSFLTLGMYGNLSRSSLDAAAGVRAGTPLAPIGKRAVDVRDAFNARVAACLLARRTERNLTTDISLNSHLPHAPCDAAHARGRAVLPPHPITPGAVDAVGAATRLRVAWLDLIPVF